MIKKILSTVVVSLLLSGCSVKLMYNNMDRFVRWQVSDFVDLDRSQRQYLDENVKLVLQWHRTTHLPMYADALDKFALQSADQMSVELLAGLFDQFYTWGLEVEQQAMPVAIHVIKSLSDEQVAKLPEKMKKCSECT